MSRYVEICRDVKLCRDMSRYVEICQDMSRYVKTCRDDRHLIPSDTIWSPHHWSHFLGNKRSSPPATPGVFASETENVSLSAQRPGSDMTWRCQMDQMVKKTTKCHIFSGNLSFHTSSSCWFINSSTDLLSISLPYFERDEDNWTQDSARCTKTSRVRNLSVRHILIVNLGHGENCEGCGLPAVCQGFELCCLSESHENCTTFPHVSACASKSYVPVTHHAPRLWNSK